MNRYTGDECAVCKVTFHDGDDVVVCPICGTPHHRACYSNDTGCVNKEWHGKKTYENEKQKLQEQAAKKCEDTNELRCPKCSAKNPSDGLFCQVCGTSLRTPYIQVEHHSSYAPPPITPNPFTTPFGGLSPDEEIDGVSAKELAVFVGNNSYYYLPKMKEIRREKKVVSWNWSAAFFHFLYFFYRKMYLLGAFVMTLYITAIVPSFIYTFKALSYGNIDYVPAELDSLYNVANICSMLFWAIQLLCGLFANYLYTETTFKRINKIRASGFGGDVNSTEYVNRLSQSGRVNTKIIVLCFLAYFLFANLLMTVLMR